MKEAVIVAGVRTAIGKVGGTLKDIEVDYLAAQVIKEIMTRSGIPDRDIDEVIFGHTKQSGDNPNVARLAWLRANMCEEVPAYTVHRQCGSALTAVNNAVMSIWAGAQEIVLVGGAESMSTAPYYLRKARYGFRMGNAEILDSNTESQPRCQPQERYGYLNMGLTAENLAEKYNISRQEQDEFALSSQERAMRAIKEGLFKEEIVPYEVKGKKGTITFDTDEHPRETNIEQLAKLPPVFKEEGTVTAGNSSGRNDGAAVLLVTTPERAKGYGLKPLVRVIGLGAKGVPPQIMGIGPVPSSQAALKMAGLTLDQIDRIELNEAFAAQSLAVIKELGLDMAKTNVNGGAIALGHPLGATGAIILIKLINELKRSGKQYGLATMCIGGGQGISTVVENLS
ncbi:acetyl-CoA acetyltransferase [Desulfosporosinus acidiphilus SJ4]|uniref:Acetyl-CoA acetyltransferase n=1 Tax=Desulfosporosinus acidiphilus (strain DSM 22704 / JCM 16185 / SJ4) TaxID=646529 RepID=I4D1T9_DESAJ|nr:thiolase family protein [Desulfosporosinus acidiphilus]AFM39763.1 acetyl-CoA acetyltransferase [Desulfosporosinus acidiphilus SJ4]